MPASSTKMDLAQNDIGFMFGFAYRRTQQLLALFPTILDEPDETKKQMLQKVSRLAYTKTESPITKQSFFKPFLVPEYFPINVPLDDIDLSVSKVKEPLSIKIELNPHEIEFSAGPQTRSFFIKNESNASPKQFFIQISDSSYFEVSPTFGILAPSESLIIEVKFIPRLGVISQTPMIKEYLCFRSKAGAPEGR